MKVLFVWEDNSGMPREDEWPLDTVPFPGDHVNMCSDTRPNEPVGVVTARQLRVRESDDIARPYWRVTLR